MPTAKLPPFTASTAVPTLPDTVSAALPSTVLPFANDTLPVGAPLCDDPPITVPALTVAVRTVTELCAIAAGLAVTTVVVLVGVAGVPTVKITGVDDEAPKLAFPP